MERGISTTQPPDVHANARDKINANGQPTKCTKKNNYLPTQKEKKHTIIWKNVTSDRHLEGHDLQHILAGHSNTCFRSCCHEVTKPEQVPASCAAAIKGAYSPSVYLIPKPHASKRYSVRRNPPRSDHHPCAGGNE